MPSDYTPSVTPYRVPDDTDPPDVPADIRAYAARISEHGFRTKWNSGIRTEGATASSGANIPGDLAAGFSGTVAAVSSAGLAKSTYAPRAVAFLWGFIMCGTLDNAAGYVGITDNVAGGNWLARTRWHNRDTPSGIFTLPAFAVDYYDPNQTPGWSLYVTVDATGTALTVREAQITTLMYPINQ